jgi:hypothetical protein
MSIIVGILLPPTAVTAIQKAMFPYNQYLEEKIPKERWYIPLMKLSALPPITPLKHPFHQTVRILSIGKGEYVKNLCVRVQMTPSLVVLQSALQAYVAAHGITATAEKRPRIPVGSLTTTPPFGVLDTPLGITSTIQSLSLIQPDPYEIIGSIDIIS